MSPIVQTYMQQARSFLLEGEPVRAIELLKKAKALCRGEPHVMTLILKDLVAACRSAGRPEEAGRYFLELRALSPSEGMPMQANAMMGGANMGGNSMADSGMHSMPHSSPGPIPWRPILAVCIALLVTVAGVGGVYWATRPRTSTPIVAENQREQRINENIGLVVIMGLYKSEDGRRFDIPFFSGTAFAFQKDGYMLTNRHVVDGRKMVPDSYDLGKTDPVHVTLKQKRIMVCFGKADGDHVDATVSPNERIDMAVLKVNRTFEHPYHLLDGLPHLGSHVLHVGYPGEVMDFLNDANRDEDKVEQAMTQMRSSGKFDLFNLRYQAESFKPEGFGGSISRPQTEFPDEISTEVVKWVQFDGVLHHGESGGPLLDDEDNVVGMVTRFMNGEKEAAGVNFAVSSTELRKEVSVYVKD